MVNGLEVRVSGRRPFKKISGLIRDILLWESPSAKKY